jgi:sucrose-6-phosphate hydrolase SacC (GH32 family)
LYLLIGSGTDGQGGTVLAYTSKNIIDWKYKGPFYISDNKKYPHLGIMWELPVFLPLGQDKAGIEKHILLISPLGPEADVEVFTGLILSIKMPCGLLLTMKNRS